MEISIEQHNQMAERLTELEYKEAERQWIPCSERLPKKPDRYLVTVHPDYIVPNCLSIDMLLWQEGKWQFFDEPLHLTEFPAPIIAWQPLPEPYQEGEKNDS